MSDAAIERIAAMGRAEYRDLIASARKKHVRNILNTSTDQRILCWSVGDVVSILKGQQVTMTPREAVRISDLRGRHTAIWEMRDPSENHRVMYYRTTSALIDEVALGVGDVFAI